jgi:hypothetical protein
MYCLATVPHQHVPMQGTLCTNSTCMRHTRQNRTQQNNLSALFQPDYDLSDTHVPSLVHKARAHKLRTVYGTWQLAASSGMPPAVFLCHCLSESFGKMTLGHEHNTQTLTPFAFAAQMLPMLCLTASHTPPGSNQHRIGLGMRAACFASWGAAAAVHIPGTNPVQSLNRHACAV